jgi:hypothetical protein
MNDHDARNIYINFVLYAVLGKMAEADGLMRKHGNAIYQVADVLARVPFEVRPIYRGMLLDPAVPYQPDKRLTFQSWTEDRDVARWFASTRSYVSGPLAKHNPKLRAHIAKREHPGRVLFHYGWFGHMELASLAMMHPHMGTEGARQIAWSLVSQSEVITVPHDLEPERVDEPHDVARLDEQLCPPWLKEYA